MEAWLVIICIVWYSREMAPPSIVIDTEFSDENYVIQKLQRRRSTFLW